MASFVMKQMVGGKINEMKGALSSGDKEEGEKTETGEDPEVIQARIEQEERRKEKHRKMENEREKMREGIRDKYSIKKKEDELPMMPDCDGRVGAARKKSPEELANEIHAEDDRVATTVKGFLPFGK